MRMTAAERFDHYTPVRGDGCWVWQGKRRSGSGYGVISVGSKEHYAHRWSYEHFIGQIPDGLLVRHSCDNRPCVNPAHLLVGTVADNARDAMERNRLSMAERHSPCLTDEDVREIRRRRAAGERGMDLAAEFGVAQSTVCMIVKRQHWKSVE